MSQYHRIPDELKQLRQWINWKYEIVNDRQTKVPLNPANGNLASVTNPLDWSSFDRAVDSSLVSSGIGFVFTRSDPYCGIDLDNPEGDQDIIRRQNEIYNTLASYSEYSPSVNGLHIIVKASLNGTGRRRNKVECYDSGRFFTFTGNRYNNMPIRLCQQEVEVLYASLSNPNALIQLPGHLINEAQTADDASIINQATIAANGAKFARLYRGDWQTDYPPPLLSQSEADFALINIIGFYTKNRIQVARIFHSSGLGQRRKAHRAAYLNWMIDKAFDRMPPKADLDELTNQRIALLATSN